MGWSFLKNKDRLFFDHFDPHTHFSWPWVDFLWFFIFRISGRSRHCICGLCYIIFRKWAPPEPIDQVQVGQGPHAASHVSGSPMVCLHGHECIGNRIFSSDVVQTGAICAAVGSQDAKSKLREIAEKRAEDVEEVMLHLEKTLACLGNRVERTVEGHAEIVLEHVGTCWNLVQCWCWLLTIINDITIINHHWWYNHH